MKLGSTLEPSCRAKMVKFLVPTLIFIPFIKSVVVDDPNAIKSCNDIAFLEYQECGTACPLECGKAPTKFCNEMCVADCFCKEGYCLNKEGDFSRLAATLFKYFGERTHS